VGEGPTPGSRFTAAAAEVMGVAGALTALHLRSGSKTDEAETEAKTQLAPPLAERRCGHAGEASPVSHRRKHFL